VDEVGGKKLLSFTKADSNESRYYSRILAIQTDTLAMIKKRRAAEKSTAWNAHSIEMINWPLGVAQSFFVGQAIVIGAPRSGVIKYPSKL
jgi:hypothetical protein